MSEVPSPETKTPQTTPTELDPVVAEALDIMSGLDLNPENTAETTPSTNLESRLSLDGLRLAINKGRLDRAKSKLQILETSPDVYKERASAFSELVPHKKKPGRLDYREQNPKLTPVTFGERRQDIRNGRRQAKANRLRYDNQYRLKEVWGEDIGKPEFVERIKSERRGFMSRRHALKAHREFNRLQEGYFGKIGGIEPRQRRVKRSAKGEDVPGRIVNSQFMKNRIERKRAKVDKLREKVEAIAARMPQSNQNEVPSSPDTDIDSIARVPGSRKSR